MKLKYFLFLSLIACASLPDSRQDLSALKNRPLKHQIKKFRSDGCSRWPEGSGDKPHRWLKCCFQHDIAYWVGGAEKYRKIADKEFKQCLNKVSSSFMSNIMYTGVRIGGSAAFDTDYQWGYGWNYDRGYLALNLKEKEYIKNIMPKKGENLLDYLNLEAVSKAEALPREIPIQSIKIPQLSK